MAEKEKIRKPFVFNRHWELVLKKLPVAGSAVYGLSSDQGKRLTELGFLIRPNIQGPYFVTEKVAQVLAEHPPKHVVIGRSNTEKVVDYVNKLSMRVSNAQIQELLAQDASRGIDTSPKFIRSKGRRAPRRTGK